MLQARFGKPVGGLRSKTSATDQVSEADVEAERVIVSRIRATRPDDRIVAEEGTDAAGASGVTWLVDPLDGTTNYLYGIPHWAISIACLDDRSAVAGVVFDPSRGELFTATRGRGAALNGTRLHVSAQRDIGAALIATGFGYESTVRAKQAATVALVLPRIRDVRRAGAAALDLAWVAAGRLDGYFETGVQSWDVEAGALLVREAGGRVTHVEGVGSDRRAGVVASNQEVYSALLALLNIRG